MEEEVEVEVEVEEVEVEVWIGGDECIWINTKEESEEKRLVRAWGTAEGRRGSSEADEGRRRRERKRRERGRKTPWPLIVSSAVLSLNNDLDNDRSQRIDQIMLTCRPMSDRQFRLSVAECCDNYRTKVERPSAKIDR